MGRTFPWYSSRRSDFSYDFHASFDDFLDLTLLGPAGTWEEPKGRATAFRTGARDTLRYHDECDD